MKRIALLLCLLTSACATARVTQPWPEDLAPGEAPQKVTRGTAWSDSTGITRGTALSDSTGITPARAVHRMALGRLPPMKLREMALGASIDFLAHGSTPSGAGDVFCGTSTTAAAFRSPAACGLATGTNYWTLSGGILSPTGITAPQDIEMAASSSSTTTPSLFGWTSFTSGQAVELVLGDTNNLIRNANGDVPQVITYHTLELWGNEQGATVPWNTTDHGSVEIIGTPTASGGPALTISKNVSGTITHGQAISFSGRVTSSRASASIAANTCNALSTATLNGVALGAECEAGVGTADSLSVQPTCQVDGANSIRWKVCNPTAAAITYPASGSVTLSCRCWNP